MTLAQDIEKQSCGCDTPALTVGLASVEQALAAGLALAGPITQCEVVPVSAACGRVLGAAVRAKAAMPPFDNSAMDGYALRRSDLVGAGPWTLAISGRIAAGSPNNPHLPAGTAARIFTGAPVPCGADAVVMQEFVERKGDYITLDHCPDFDENIRRRGEDIACNAEVLPIGKVLGPRDIALAAGAGAGAVCVHRKLRIALLTTGDEVQPAGQPLERGCIWDVNTPMMIAALSGAATVVTTQTVADDAQALEKCLRRLSMQVDLIVTTGGVSVGEEDHMHAAIHAAGGEISVAGVAVKPGKPLTLARIGQCCVVGLPGNPVSALVTWTIFGKPIAARLAGSKQYTARYRQVVADRNLSHKLGRCEYRPAKIVAVDDCGRDVVSAGSATHSAKLLPLAGADGMVVIPAETKTVKRGERLEFLLFEPNF